MEYEEAKEILDSLTAGSERTDPARAVHEASEILYTAAATGKGRVAGEAALVLLTVAAGKGLSSLDEVCELLAGEVT
jgi:hypothetical protein